MTDAQRGPPGLPVDVWRLLFAFLDKISVIQMGYTNKDNENLVFREIPGLFETTKIPKNMSSKGLVSFFARINAKETIRFLDLTECCDDSATDALLALGNASALESLDMRGLIHGRIWGKKREALLSVVESMVRDHRLWNIQCCNMGAQYFFRKAISEGREKKAETDGFECIECDVDVACSPHYEFVFCDGCAYRQALFGHPCEGFCNDHKKKGNLAECFICNTHYCADCKDDMMVCAFVCVCDFDSSEHPRISPFFEK